MWAYYARLRLFSCQFHYSIYCKLFSYLLTETLNMHIDFLLATFVCERQVFLCNLEKEFPLSNMHGFSVMGISCSSADSCIFWKPSGHSCEMFKFEKNLYSIWGKEAKAYRTRIPKFFLYIVLILAY